jgi:hypothetical protein
MLLSILLGLYLRYEENEALWKEYSHKVCIQLTGYKLFTSDISDGGALLIKWKGIFRLTLLR